MISEVRDPKFRSSVGTFVCVEGRTSTVATCECIEHRRSGFLERASGTGDRRSVKQPGIDGRQSTSNVHRASKVGFQQPSIVHRRSGSKSFTYIVHRPWNGPTVRSLDLWFHQPGIFSYSFQIETCFEVSCFHDINSY